jgi:hypothetical protein
MDNTSSTTEDIREITTLEAFQSAIADRAAFLVVTDRSTPTRVHRTTCAAVLPQHFVTKVVTNGAKRGRYFKAPSYGAASSRFTSRPCGVCHPEQP